MMALAWQTNQTRIASFKLANEATMRVYNMVNVQEAFHPLSHHGEDPEKFAKLVRIQAFHTERMAKFAKRLQGMKEGEGSILDSAIILFGSNMANSDRHNNDPLPQALIGKGCGKIKGGQHCTTRRTRRTRTFWSRCCSARACRWKRFSNSTGVLSEV